MNDILLQEIESYLSENYLYYEDEKKPQIMASARIKFSFKGNETPPPREPISFPRRIKNYIDAMFSTIEDDDTFGGYVGKLIRERSLTDAEVYKKADMDRRLFSKIRRNRNYQPSRSTALSLAIALELDMEETQQLLQRAGFTLSKGSKSDVIVMCFIERGEYDRFLINEVMDHYNCGTLYFFFQMSLSKRPNPLKGMV